MKDRTIKSIIGSKNPLETARVYLAPYNHLKVNQEISSCSMCETCTSSKKINYGNPNADILIVSDYASNIPKIDNLLNQIFYDANLTNNDMYFTYAVNCICTRSDGNMRMPTYTELKNCKTHTDFVIDFVKPKVIISMGATALNQFVPDHINLLKNIDATTCYKGIPTIVTYSMRDIYNFSKIGENVQDKIDSIIHNINKAKEVIK